MSETVCGYCDYPEGRSCSGYVDGGYMCTRKEGHPGVHVACTFDSHVLATSARTPGESVRDLAEDLHALRSGVSTWLTRVLDVGASTVTDEALLALREWVDGGGIGELPDPGAGQK